MKYIHTPEDATGEWAGFGDDTIPEVEQEEPGLSAILAGPDELYGRMGLNQFPTSRLHLSVHTWPPGKDHGSHHHPSWEQCYYIFAGQAEITVGEETKLVGPGSSAHMPPGAVHNITAVGDETLVAAVATCMLDEDALE